MHYPVMVITESGEEEAVRDLLAPFSEEITVEAYVEYSYAEVKQDLYERCDSGLRCADELKRILDADDIEALRKLNRDYSFFEDINEKGEAMTCYNPQGKWDFYGWGGRWGILLNGEGRVRLKDFPRLRKRQGNKALGKKFPAIYAEWKQGSGKRPGCHDFFDYLVGYYAYAILTPEGEWHEPGRNAWWMGALKGVEGPDTWVSRFNRILDSYPQEWYVTLIDCHI